MAAAGQHYEPLAADVRDQRLIVEDQRIGLPPLAAKGLMDGEAALEVRGPVDFAGDQQRAVEQERRVQNSGCMSTGIFCWPSTVISPDRPVVWSKWPWLQTTASMSPGS
jgi:hypothetical protein